MYEILSTKNWDKNGYVIYKGSQYAMQNPHAFKVFEDFFNMVKFDNVIELGTANGGFGLFLHEQSIKHNFKYVTFDHNEIPMNMRSELFKEYNFDYRIRDIYTEDAIQEIRDLVKLPGKTLLLCDAGQKVVEFNTYSEDLKDGDYIMAHDYAPSKTYFDEVVKDKIWSWMEIEDQYIQESIDKYNLKQQDFNTFQSVAWCCFLK